MVHSSYCWLVVTCRLAECRDNDKLCVISAREWWVVTSAKKCTVPPRTTLVKLVKNHADKRAKDEELERTSMSYNELNNSSWLQLLNVGEPMRLEAVGFGCVASAEARESKVCFLMNQGEVEVHVLFGCARDWNWRESVCVCLFVCIIPVNFFLERIRTHIHLSCIAENQGINWWLESNAAGCCLEALTIFLASASARWCLFHSIGERLEPSSRWSSNSAHKQSFYFPTRPPWTFCGFLEVQFW